VTKRVPVSVAVRWRGAAEGRPPGCRAPAGPLPGISLLQGASRRPQFAYPIDLEVTNAH
jgi:hypothetical protein